MIDTTQEQKQIPLPVNCTQEWHRPLILLGSFDFSTGESKPWNGISPFMARSTSGTSSMCSLTYFSRNRFSVQVSSIRNRCCGCFPDLLSTASTAHLRERVSRLRPSKPGLMTMSLWVSPALTVRNPTLSAIFFSEIVIGDECRRTI